MSSPLPSFIAKTITSPRLRDLRRAMAEKKRQRQGSGHKITVYLRINDAYSYLLLQTLKSLAERFPLEYEFRTVLNLQDAHYPAPRLWHKNASLDARYLASLYDLQFPQTTPESTEERDTLLTAQLLHWELQPGFLDNALKLFHAYWADDEVAVTDLLNPNVSRNAECYRHHQENNENLLKKSGHYLSGILHYGGEWYWSIPRLSHLEQRLNQLGIQNGQADIVFDREYKDFCSDSAEALDENKKQQAITIYWSARSPYSYIGLVRARQLARHYEVPLIIKPVLPMVMRRMQVPRNKGFYIMQDVKREAMKYGLPYGNVADPLGAGVERCYALFNWAEQQSKAGEFAESFARGVWAEGIRSDTDAGLKILVERAGLDWQEAKSLLQDDSWRIWAQENLAEMYGNDLWGVPSFKYEDACLFGQDQLGHIEAKMLGRI